MALRILIAEGNVQKDREIFTRFNGCAPSGMFDRLLKGIRSDVSPEIFYPTEPDSRPALPLDAYDGILFTGSNSNIYKREPGTLRQIEFAVAAFSSGTPMFGVCWGLQLATVAAGGTVEPSQAADCRCEAPFAFDVSLTAQGRRHGMHLGRPDVFDAFAFHSDQVTRLPPLSIITAENRNFIQAVEIRGERSVFWGVQYHPELDGAHTAGFMRGSIAELVDGGRCADEEAIERIASALERFAPGAEMVDEDRALLAPANPADFEFRPALLQKLCSIRIPSANPCG